MTRLTPLRLAGAVMLATTACGMMHARWVLPQPPTVLALSGCYVRDAAVTPDPTRQFPDTLALTTEPDATPTRQPAWRVRTGPGWERVDHTSWSWSPNARHPDSVAVWNNGIAGLTLGATIKAGRLNGVTRMGQGNAPATAAYAATRQQCLGFRR